MLPIIVLLLAGLTALGFLSVVWRRRAIPAPLRAILIVVAVAVVAYIAWVLAAALKTL